VCRTKVAQCTAGLIPALLCTHFYLHVYVIRNLKSYLNRVELESGVAKARLSPRGNDRRCVYNIWLEKTGLGDNSNPETWDWERLTFVTTHGGSLFLIDIKSAFNMSFFLYMCTYSCAISDCLFFSAG
jgi:hypothetical protein